jgi:2-phosphosulfolactate phosphatase
MNRKPFIDVCFTPTLFSLFNVKESIVVVIDVLRATSSMCIAFEYGANQIVPVKTVEESLAYKQKGFLIGAERHGEMVDGFDIGNSPFSYMLPKIKGANIALTTTNGTQAINVASIAHKVVIGSFLNLSALCDYLINENRDVVCLCSGWKNSFNLEDTLLAGAIAKKLENNFTLSDHRDSTIAAKLLCENAQDNFYVFLNNSSHRKRLADLHIDEDVKFCLEADKTKCVPYLSGNALIV